MNIISRLFNRGQDEQNQNQQTRQGGASTVVQDLPPDGDYIDLIRQQQQLRYEAGQSGQVGMNAQLIQGILNRHNDQFEGDLYVALANDFGVPAGFAPQPDAAPFAHLADDVRASKWGPSGNRLRQVWRDLQEVPGVHKCIPAVADYDDGSLVVRYDITPPAVQEYTWVTLREVLGLLDWIVHAGGDDGVVVY